MLSVEQIAPRRVIPVVVLDDARDAEGVRDALVAGGLACAEITFRTDAAVDAIGAMSQDPAFVVGAGTVISPAQVERAVAAGARFVVSPGLSEAVVAAARALGVPCIPGAVTATEIMRAIDLGLDTVKFFPAGTSGGLAAITALAAPFPAVRFVPTGGIRPDNLADYLASPAVAAVGGSWLTPREAVQRGDLNAVRRLAAEASSANREPA